MLKAFGFGKTGDSSVSGSPNAKTIRLIDDAIALEIALKSMDLLMDDQMHESLEIVKKHNHAIVKLAHGVINFIEATLGFEPEAIKQASNTLYEAEQAAYKEHQRASHANVSASSHFPPGLEYSVAYAEAQLLSAVTLFLSESVIDSAKALFKLRKAYQTIEDVNKQINIKQLLSQKSGTTLSSSKNKSILRKDSSSKQNNGTITRELIATAPEVHDKLKQFYKLRLERLKLNSDENSIEAQIEGLIDDPTQKAGQETIDEYIISAVNACFGLLQLILSIIPSGIGKVLSIVGFHGSEHDGLTLLWKSTSQVNIHASIGLLALLQFYDGPTQVSDITLPEIDNAPSEASSQTLIDVDSPVPNLDDAKDVKRKLRMALLKALKHYPRGALWQLQEGRMKASDGDLEGAVVIMNDTSRGPINLRQVEGLMLFDKTIMMLALHDFENSAKNFLQLIEINTWSHTFYTYLSAICQVEIYRKNKSSDTETAEKAKAKAKQLLEEAPSYMNRKKILSKPMPFDRFVLRKIDQWKEIEKSKKIHLVDAIGTSPAHEVIYFYNGYGRMSRQNLEETMQILGATAGKDKPYSNNAKLEVDETEDDALIRYLLQAVTLRNLGKPEEGLKLLETEVIPKIYQETPNKGHFKSGIPKVYFYKKHSDQWVAPSAIYEVAVMHWAISGASKVQLVRDYLELALSWAEDYELSTRVQLKIKSALTRLDRIK